MINNPSYKIIKNNSAINDKIQATRAFIVLHDTSLAALLTYIDCVATEGGPAVAWTNGVKIFLRKDYFDLNRDNRCAILLHQISHIALRHVQRCFQRIAYPEIMNWVTDALINSGLKAELEIGRSWCALPHNAITVQNLLRPQDYSSSNVSDWNSHKLYKYVLENASKKGQGGGGGNGGSGESTLEDAVAKYIEKLKQQHPNLHSDLVRDKETDPTINNELEDARWESRVQKAIGSNPKSLLAKLYESLDKSDVPWHKVLKRWMKAHCMPETVENWNRAGRAMLASRTRVFSPGIRPKKGLNNCSIIIDASGSCFSKKQQRRFASEVQAIQKQTSVNIYLIYADAAVAAEFYVPNDGKSFEKRLNSGEVYLQGGGGTDMRVPIARALELKSKVVIVCTDGYTPFPTKQEIRGMDLIWCVNSDAEIPIHCGKVIRVPEE